jgi:cyanophycin synthetase
MIRDSRRVPGASLWNDRPAALLDLLCAEPEQAVRAWHGALDALLGVCPVPDAGRRCVRTYREGATVGFEAPTSVLYEAANLNEFAAEAALRLRTLDEATAQARRLAPDLMAALDPALEALRAGGRARKVNVLIGEDVLTVGSGAGARSFALDALPAPDDVPWADVSDIPIGLVTGTNGKTTTVRLVARMLREAGRRAGFTSTESVVVDGEVVLKGDFAGPEGARRLLRDARAEVAVLETSRGGMLRRGLTVQHADAALVTNAGADHFGDYGILSVADVALAKLTVRKALRPGAPLMLNADDPALTAAADALGLTPVWFSLDADHPRLGTTAAFVQDGEIVLRLEGHEEAVIGVADVPFTFGGTARYNVQNALGALLVAQALGASLDAMRRTLAAFGQTPGDNPGRLGVHPYGDVRVVVDYAHNDDGVNAVAPALLTLPAQRRLVLISQAGDRSDDDNRRLAVAILQLDPAVVMITELPGYERDRAPGETSESLARGFEAGGYDRARLRFAARPGEGARALLREARGGELVVLFLHSDRPEVEALLKETPAFYRPASPKAGL